MRAREVLGGLVLRGAAYLFRVGERLRAGPLPEEDLDHAMPAGHPTVGFSGRALEMRAEPVRTPSASPPPPPLAGSAAERRYRATSRG